MPRKRPSFPSHDAYSAFAFSVSRHMRYVQAPEVREFLATVAATAASRARILGPDIDLRRAQIGGHREPMFESDQIGQITGPFRPERMKPIDGLAKEGRVNPSGIAYLYLSSNPETAIAETRPWIGAWISLGTFRLARDVRIVDCTIGRRKWVPHLDEPSAAERERCVWRDINEAFARPVVADESPTEYVPTQVLGDLFQSEGFGGISFRSSCARGHNLVLFSTLLAELVRCNLLQIQSLRYRHVWTGAVYNLEESPRAAPSN